MQQIERETKDSTPIIVSMIYCVIWYEHKYSALITFEYKYYNKTTKCNKTKQH